MVVAFESGAGKVLRPRRRTGSAPGASAGSKRRSWRWPSCPE